MVRCEKHFRGNLCLELLATVWRIIITVFLSKRQPRGKLFRELLATVCRIISTAVWCKKNFRCKLCWEFYDARYKKLRLYARATVPLELVRAIHFTRGNVFVHETPHYALFADWLKGTKSLAEQEYASYMKSQYGYDPKQMHQRMEANRALLQSQLDGSAAFEIACIPRDGVFVVLDGLHRLALISALGQSNNIPVAVVDAYYPRLRPLGTMPRQPKSCDFIATGTRRPPET
jgi:hypothetical protein